MSSIRRIVLAAVALLILMSACVPEKARKEVALAEQGVDDFHLTLNQGKYHEIYEHAADSFQAAGKREDFLEAMGQVSTKLGTLMRSNKTSWRVGYSTRGTRITLTYDSQFSKGYAVEEFVWCVENQKAKLCEYVITSPALFGHS